MKSASLLFVTPFFSGTSNMFFRADVSCFLLVKVSKRNPKCALTDATEIRLTDIACFSWFPSSLAYNFLRSIPTHFNISKSPATTYQIRPLSLLARKTILMLLRCEGRVVLMSWRRIHLKEERRQSLLFSSLPFLQSRVAAHLTPVASRAPASFAGWERKKGLHYSLDVEWCFMKFDFCKTSILKHFFCSRVMNNVWFV